MNITAIALNTVIGNTLPALAQNLAKGSCPLTSNHRFREWIDVPLGEIPEIGLLASQGDPFAHFTCRLIHEIATSTDLFKRYRPQEIGLFFGSTTSGYHHTIAAMNRSLADEKDSPTKTLAKLLTLDASAGRILTLVRNRFPIKGLSLNFSTACSSAALAIGEAVCALKSGQLKAVIAGGVDLLNLTTILGFDALQVLSHHVCRPFHQDREGMNLAEGGALVLLEAKPRDIPPIALVSGYGAATDHYHLTHPEPDGKGMEQSMARALSSGGFHPTDIGYINAHGTGTIPNDAAESSAIARLFPEDTPFNSTKGTHGHALGAAGAIEAALVIAMLAGYLSPKVILDSLAVSPKPIDHCLSNSFGFGGNNVSLIFSKALEEV